MSDHDPALPRLTEQQVVRFWSYVDKTPGQGPKGDCWEWKKGRRRRGYGRFRARPSGTADGRGDYIAHRLAFYLTQGRWPNDCACHECDNPPCCNPAHLWEGTRDDNQKDAARKGRIASGARHGTRTHPERVKRGEDSHYAKLTVEKVRAIRRARAERSETCALLAIRYSVCIRTIFSIAAKKTWAHVS